MAIKVNGLLVAGLGKSAYEQAQEGGYTGTEEEFISALANIGSNPTAEGLPVNDVRTGTVRDGQSIAAGDVVNVRALGKTVAIQWNGKPTLFRAVQVGNPAPSIYDASCDGIWVMAVDYLTRMIIGLNNDYKASNAHTWCNGDFIDGFETELQEKIKMVKIPYWDGTGTEGSLKNGAEGLSTKGFLPSLDEFGYPQSEARSMGHMLSAFKSGKPPVTKSNYFLCRNPTSTNTTEIFGFLTYNPSSKFTPKATQEANFTPCFILPLDTDLSTIGTVVEDNYDVYRDVVAQKNVENRLNTVVMTGSDLFKLNESYSILIGNSSSNPAAYLIDNTTGKSVYSVSAYSSAVLSISGARLDDSHFVVTYVSGNDFRIQGYTVSGTSLTPMGNAGYSDVNEAIVIGFDTDSALSIAARETNIYVRPYQPSITTLYGGKSLSGIRPSNISATRIPDDDSGNKRVCICFSDTGDGNKGKAVIATIDSSNAVTFGEVATIINSTAHHVQCTYSNGVIYALSQTTLYVFNEALSVLGNAGLYGSGTSGADTALIGLPTGVVAVNGSTNYNAVFATWNGTSIEHGSPYKFNIGNPSNYVSGTRISDNEILLAYADTGNSNYGTTTILEISGNQIAGSFLDNSKDAIALESGEGGDTIKTGFGGYCACEGMTAGQTIDSEGVTAYSPLDGWLEIKDQWAKGYVTGEYTGNGTYGADNPTVIDVGFRPSVIVIILNYLKTTQVVPNSFVFANGMTGYRFNSNDNNGSVLTWTDVGVSIYNSVNPSFQYNNVDYKYHYIAWR